MAKRIFGDVPGHPEGSRYRNRWELHQARVHGPTMAGIWGGEREGAESIVLNGGYEDDVDSGDVITYTGHGGNDMNTGEQIANQELSRGNQALARNSETGLPVRVIRGPKSGKFGPMEGYRYDGLYTVEKYWSESGKSGNLIWRFRLVKK
jgi:putative restriction endonuclease